MNGDWESQLSFFSKATVLKANNTVDTAKQLIAHSEQDIELIQAQGRFAGTLSQIQRAMLRRPVTKATWLKKDTGLVPATIQSGLQKLESLNILQELTGKQRDRVYAYAEYIAILNRGNELP